jgi:hypothetical protein
VILDRPFEVSISFISARLPSLVGHGHEPQPGGSEQRSDKKRFRYFTLGFAAQMRLECCPECGFSGENALTPFIMLLSRRRGHDRIDQGVFHFESVGEMLCDQRRGRACRQQFGERLVAVADLTVAETATSSLRLIPSARARSKMKRPIGYLSSPKRA